MDIGGARKLLPVCEDGAEELHCSTELSEVCLVSSSLIKSLCKRSVSASSSMYSLKSLSESSLSASSMHCKRKSGSEGNCMKLLLFDAMMP